MPLKLMIIYLGLLSNVFACSTCMVGDPTLTLMGAEKSYNGRLRLSADYLYRTEKTGVVGFNQTQLTERRITLGLGYSWNENLYFLYASSVYHYAFKGFDEFKAGQAIVTTLAGQYALKHSLALQLALETRWNKQNKQNKKPHTMAGLLV